MLAAVKKLWPICGIGVANMWCTEAEADESSGDECEHHGRVAEDGTAGEGLDNGGDEPECGDEDDVDLGVAEEPEEMLPENRIAALGGIEEVRGHEPIERDEVAGHHHGGHGEDDHE